MHNDNYPFTTRFSSISLYETQRMLNIYLQYKDKIVIIALDTIEMKHPIHPFYLV